MVSFQHVVQLTNGVNDPCWLLCKTGFLTGRKRLLANEPSIVKLCVGSGPLPIANSSELLAANLLVIGISLGNLLLDEGLNGLICLRDHIRGVRVLGHDGASASETFIDSFLDQTARLLGKISGKLQIFRKI
jgi:hypothetical protein